MSYALIEYPDREKLAVELADLMFGELRARLDRAPRAAMAVSGGTSPGPVFDALSQARLDWDRVDILLTDERWVPETSERSNTALLRQRLLVDRAAAARLVPLYRDGSDPEAALPHLTDGVAGCLPLDVVLLGMGSDMHTASLFPGADLLAEGLASDAPPVLPMRAPGAAEPRITLTAQVLNGAASKHVLIFGDEKRAALKAAEGKPAEAAPINAVLSGAKVHWVA